MHSGVATGFDVSTKDNIGKEPFGDMSDCYGLIRNVSVYYGNNTIYYGTTRVKASSLRMNNGLLQYK